jgi:ABC-type multidrug transport system ATPase subunit/pSer/pThr/pTyr-binding forkhead associated (FHA) protein
MIEGLGKQTITIGSAAGSEVRLGGPGVAPEHARIVNQGGGRLVFVDSGQGTSMVDGQALPPGGTAPFDFKSQFVVGQVPVPNAHPAIAMMLMSRGQAQAESGRLVFGRDPARAHVVIAHPNVSGVHATFQLEPLSVTDERSTSGTFVAGQPVTAGTPRPLEPHAMVALGPVSVPAQLVLSLARSGFATRESARQLTTAEPAAADSRIEVRAEAGGETGVAQVVGGSVEVGGTAAVPSVAAAGSAALPAAGGGFAPAGPGPSPGGARHKTVMGQVQLPAQARKTIGRTPDNDIQIPHAQVSSKHAELLKIGSQLFIEDKGSANGTYVRGKRLAAGERASVENGEKVFLGPMPLLLQFEAEALQVVVEDQANWEGRPLYEIEAWDLLMQVPNRDNPSELKTLLDHVSFKALPGDLIALMGPSGAGKTTLLMTLNGYLPPTSGQVRINGEDLYAIYDALRGSIGYVPQDDIVHPELTVYEAVRYSAKFRLPPDYSEEEIDRRVTTTLQQLGLEAVAHLQIGKPEKKVLSGGQRKRVNIAMELVTDPVIMFLDEPTSGLAADDTTALVALLSDLAKKTGKTIITTIHQPAKDEYEKFNLALILGTGGITIYYGPTTSGYKFFGSWLERNGRPNTVDNPRDMFAMLQHRERPIFDTLKTQNPGAGRSEARSMAAREWNREFFDPQNPIFQQMFSGRRAVGEGSQSQGVHTGRVKTSGQFSLLFSRYFKVKVRDVSGTAIMLAQAPIIGALLSMVFGGQKLAAPYWCLGALNELATKSGGLGDNTNKMLSSLQPTPDHAGAIFFLLVSAVWFGTSNAAREIVSETAIYKRERMVNLGLFNYVFSKFLLLSIFCVVQCTVLLAIVFFALGFHGGLPAFGIELVTMIVTAMNSVALGLLVSSLVTSSEAAMALTPIALIPQVVLGGLMVPMTTNPLLKWPMLITPARWGFQGVVGQERLAIQSDPAWVLNLNKPDTTSAPDFVFAGKFHCAQAQIASTELNGAWGFTNYDVPWMPIAVLTGMMLGLLCIILVILKQRDSI